MVIFLSVQRFPRCEAGGVFGDTTVGSGLVAHDVSVCPRTEFEDAEGEFSESVVPLTGVCFSENCPFPLLFPLIFPLLLPLVLLLLSGCCCPILFHSWGK